ncbi:MAG: divergent polysaccharide deacetylase family protein, partial [Pseudomonadota bacterium]
MAAARGAGRQRGGGSTLRGIVYGLILAGAGFVAVSAIYPRSEFPGPAGRLAAPLTTDEGPRVSTPPDAAVGTVAAPDVAVVEIPPEETAAVPRPQAPAAAAETETAVAETTGAPRPEGGEVPGTLGAATAPVGTAPTVAAATGGEASAAPTAPSALGAPAPETPPVIGGAPVLPVAPEADLAPIAEEAVPEIDVAAADTAPETAAPDPEPVEDVAAEEPAPAAEDVATERTGVPDFGGPAWEIFRAAHVRETDRPLLSVVLVDLGGDGLPLETLAEYGVPFTFAIAADLPDADQRAETLRAAGFEVVVVPPAAGDAYRSGRDAAALTGDLAGMVRAVPGAVGVLDRIDGDLAGDPRLAEDALAAMAPSGHLLLTYQGAGLPSGVRSRAQEAGVPSLAISRVIDARPDPENIRAQLNGALREAITDGHTVVVAR